MDRFTQRLARNSVLLWCCVLLWPCPHARGQDLSNQDECATAQLDRRAGDGTWAWDNSSATTGSEGQNESFCYAFSTTGIDGDVWFVWEPTADGPVRMSTCAAGGTNDDTKIAAYTGDCCPADGTAIACDDDSCAARSEISFFASCGEAYTVQLGSSPGTGAGSGFVTVTQSGTPCGPPVTQTLFTQSIDNTSVRAGNSGSCTSVPGGVFANSYWRVYDRFDYAPPYSTQSLTGDYDVREVHWAVDSATSLTGMQNISIRLYADPDGRPAGPLASLTLLGSEDVVLTDRAQTLETTVFDPPVTVPANVRYVAVEVHVFNGQDPAQQATFFPGSNSAGELQTRTSFLSAPDCGLLEPVTYESLGFGFTHLILDLLVEQPAPPDDSIGCHFCGPAAPHSGGASGVLLANGSTRIADDDVTLTATSLPANEFVLFLAGTGTGTFTPPGSQGVFCLAGGTPGTLGRFYPAGTSGLAGRASVTVNTAAVPIGSGTTAMVPGTTWNFQAYYRDGPHTNFTDAISILFQ